MLASVSAAVLDDGISIGSVSVYRGRENRGKEFAGAEAIGSCRPDLCRCRAYADGRRRMNNRDVDIL